MTTTTRHPATVPRLVFADGDGHIMDLPDLAMAGRSGHRFHLPEPEDCIPLPPGSELFVLPGRLPVGIDPRDGEPVHLEEHPFAAGEPVQAVAAFMAPAHTAIYTAAFEKTAGAPVLPLFAYTAVGWAEGRFWVTAFRSDPDPRQDADRFRQSRIDKKTAARLAAEPDNRLVAHLGRCCLTYGCPAARNFFLGRWEAPLPTSPVCNAACLGCISLQPSGCCPATQERIRFVPTVAELCGVAVPHLRTAQGPVASFGQGCEGEPLLQAETIAAAIRACRRETSRGTINCNTNGSLPAAMERLAAAGLDSCRISMNSARPDIHRRYYRPKGFDLADVRASIRVMRRAGRFVSLNYFILPGFTDDPAEARAFFELVATERPDLIQLRNLNMDPDWYLEGVGHEPAGDPLGIRAWVARLRKEFPWLRLGYFNPCLDAGA